MLARIDAVATTDVALSVSDLTVSLPLDMERQYAVENLSFDLKRGQILCIIGESGSGKSVTANAIMGLLPKVIRVTGGAMELDGRSIMGLPVDELRSLRGRIVHLVAPRHCSPGGLGSHERCQPIARLQGALSSSGGRLKL